MFRGLLRYTGRLGEGVYEVTFMNGEMTERLLPGSKASSHFNEKGLEEVSYTSFNPEDLTITFFGQKITKANIENILFGLSGYTSEKALAGPEPQIKPEEIPKEKIEELEQKFREEYHVDGSFYDGHQLRDGDGKPLKNHPSK
jgi:hypothetical protein